MRSIAWPRRSAPRERLFQRYDALLLPTAPFCPTLAEVQADPIGLNKHLGTFTNFVNLCDLAGFAVPAGFGADGLPVGVTLLGPAWSEGPAAGLADTPAPGVRHHGRRHRRDAAAGRRTRSARARTRPRCSASARTWPACR